MSDPGSSNPLSDLLNSAASGGGQSAGSQAQFGLLLQLIQKIYAALTGIGVTVPSEQKMTSGSSATYTTPAGCRQIVVRMAAGGGGGCGSGTSGTGGAGGNGTDTSFNSIVAAHGTGAPTTQQGSGGGSGAGSAFLRITGGGGGEGQVTGATATFAPIGGAGGSTPFGMTQHFGAVPQVNSGAGGPGAGGSLTNSMTAGGGGGGGEYVEFVITTPAATYTYTVGTGGAGGTAGTSGSAGKAGAAGVIIVNEIY